MSHTFHGRDIFAPVAAHLASGVAIGEVGPAVDPADLVRLHFPDAVSRDDGLDTSVLFVDSFGNCRLAGAPGDLEALRGTLAPGDRFRVALRAARSIEVTWQLDVRERRCRACRSCTTTPTTTGSPSA